MIIFFFKDHILQLAAFQMWLLVPVVIMADVASLLMISRSRIAVISTFTTYRIPRDAIRHTALVWYLLNVIL